MANQEEERLIRGLFNQYDLKKDGKLDKDEMGRMVASFGLTGNDLQEYIASTDTTGSGTISFEEFLAPFRRRDNSTVAKAQLRKIFKSYDRDGSGSLEKREIREILKKHKGWAIEKCDQCLSMCDSDADGKISFEEFLALFYDER